MSMRWPPVTLTVGMANLSTTSAIARKLRRAGDAAPHARHDREGAVLLDVGVGALVDEARLVVVGIFVGPVADQVVVECRPALGAAARGLPLELLHDRRHRLQRLRARSGGGRRRGPGSCRRTSAATALRLNASPRVSSMSCSTRPVQVPHEAEALVWARTSSSVVSPFALIVPVILPLQMPLQPQISASSGKRRDGRRGIERAAALEGRPEDQRVAHLGDVRRLLLEVVEPGAVGHLAEQHGADDPVVLQDQSLVDAGRGVAQHDLLAVVAVGEVAQSNRRRCR